MGPHEYGGEGENKGPMEKMGQLDPPITKVTMPLQPHCFLKAQATGGKGCLCLFPPLTPSYPVHPPQCPLSSHPLDQAFPPSWNLHIYCSLILKCCSVHLDLPFSN